MPRLNTCDTDHTTAIFGNKMRKLEGVGARNSVKQLTVDHIANPACCDFAPPSDITVAAQSYGLRYARISVGNKRPAFTIPYPILHPLQSLAKSASALNTSRFYAKPQCQNTSALTSPILVHPSSDNCHLHVTPRVLKPHDGRAALTLHNYRTIWTMREAQVAIHKHYNIYVV